MERIIPKNSKLKAALFKHLSLLDMLLISIMLLIAVLLFFSNFSQRWIMLAIYLLICAVMFIGDDEDRTYLQFAYLIKFYVSRRTFTKGAKKGSTDELIPFKKIRADGLIEYEGYLGAIIEVGSLDFGLLDEDEQDRRISAFARVLNGLSQSSVIQLFKIDRPIKYDEVAAGIFEKLREFIVEKCKPIEFAQCRVEEIAAPVRYVEEEPVGDILHLDENAIQFVQNNYDAPKVNILPETKKMNAKELTCLCVGDPTLMSGGIPGVVGASGQIDTKVCKKYGYYPTVMADGPAGIRISMKYAVEPNGKIKTGGKLPQDLVKAKKLFRFLDRLWSKTSKKAQLVYQFCTAWPSATVQAQTFSPELIRKIGIAVSCEMQQYKVGIWLAPGMNIQRHPLCGRNYEYYSEDPMLTAEMASALTLGVQSNERCAVTIKHFCCNNQEDNRMKSSSEVNERALREIYLKAFKLTVRKAKPKCVMSSYNKVNGTYVNSSYDLITNILRCEFGFDGVVMTDWQSVAKDQAVAGETICAENDLIMAGDKFQHKELLKAVKSGKVAKTSVQKCASRILNLCKKLNP